MITRIEVDGFKSFDEFALDLKPFTAIIGPNAGGKSNLLDAVRFVSTLLTHGINEAVSEVRGRGLTLFHQRCDGTRVDRMRFALEGVSPVTIGLPARRRCEVEVGVVNGKLDLLVKPIEPIATGADRWLAELDCSTDWREHLVRPLVREAPDPNADRHLIDMPFAGSSFLKLHDDVLREPVGAGELYPALGKDGSALTGHLAFLESDIFSDRSPMPEIRAELGSIVTEITGFDLYRDEPRSEVLLRFFGRDKRAFFADSASDGTLRALAILAALHNPARSTQLFVEEPENGLPPSRVRRLIEMMRSHATDFAIDAPGLTNQVVITSHSPIVLSAVPRENVVFLDTVTRIRDGVASDVTRARCLLAPGERPAEADKGRVVLPHELARFSDGLDTAA